MTRLDLVRELALRRWARENYVRASERRPTWHPVVLQEMQARDQEQAEAYGLPVSVPSGQGRNVGNAALPLGIGGAGYVPLLPTFTDAINHA